MIKLCTIDLDGTLFDKDKNISIENIEAIKKAKENGCKIVICTGRPMNGIKPVITKLNLLSDEDYVVCYNGSKIINVGTNEVIFSKLIDGKTIKEIYYEAKKLNLYYHAFRDNEELLTFEHNPYTDVEARINNICDHLIDFETIKDDELFLKCMIVDEKEKLDNAMTTIPKELYDKYSIVRSAGIFLEFLNKETNKGLALKALAKHLNIDMSETMAIGDAGNDLDMIRFAGIGVAMENGYDYVKEAADYITASNEENGVAKALNKFVNNC